MEKQVKQSCWGEEGCKRPRWTVADGFSLPRPLWGWRTAMDQLQWPAGGLGG